MPSGALASLVILGVFVVALIVRLTLDIVRLRRRLRDAEPDYLKSKKERE